MTREARLRETDTGLVPEGEGWFVLNARDASWETIDYPVDPVAASHGVSVPEPVSSPADAYADLDRTITRARGFWPEV